MNYALTNGTDVIRIADGARIPNDPLNTDRAAYTAWLAGGGVPTPYIPPALTLADYQRAIEAHVEGAAKARGYTSSATCASYALGTNPAWIAEALVFIAWRDAIYEAVFVALAAVEGGATPPTVAAFIASMPAIVWP